jgi:hypothetical protein
MFRRILAMCAVLLGAPTLSLGAQLVELQPGTKVRVQAPGAIARRVTGLLIARTTDSITMTRPNATPVSIPLRSLTSLEISRGKSRWRGAGKGALWGSGSMAVLFAIIPPSGCRDREGRTACEDLGRGESMAIGAVGGAFWGALIGALIGSERWDRASLPVTVGVVPSLDGRSIQMQGRVAMLW